mmetsp:Transcript_4965/g.8257  ORF Transcript_4965/g.8257 Transcript_4965/m.8257 type:complete len:244 (-) Transcript_4965:205-936(-)
MVGSGLPVVNSTLLKMTFASAATKGAFTFDDADFLGLGPVAAEGLCPVPSLGSTFRCGSSTFLFFGLGTEPPFAATPFSTLFGMGRDLVDFSGPPFSIFFLPAVVSFSDCSPFSFFDLCPFLSSFPFFFSFIIFSLADDRSPTPPFSPFLFFPLSSFFPPLTGWSSAIGCDRSLESSSCMSLFFSSSDLCFWRSAMVTEAEAGSNLALFAFRDSSLNFCFGAAFCLFLPNFGTQFSTVISFGK